MVLAVAIGAFMNPIPQFVDSVQYEIANPRSLEISAHGGVCVCAAAVVLLGQSRVEKIVTCAGFVLIRFWKDECHGCIKTLDAHFNVEVGSFL